MRQLRLVGLNDDGSRLVLRDEAAKADYLLPADERLAAALRGDRARLGQLEIKLESQLRPREMQSRVRGGESAESVATAANIPLDRVQRLVAPVMAEREYIAEKAQMAAVRRPGGEGPGLVLGATVEEKLVAKGIAPESLTWDSWRRDDGRWTVQVAYRFEDRDRTAQWTFDPETRSAVAADDDAAVLCGIRPKAPAIVATPAATADYAAAAAAFGFAPDVDPDADTGPIELPRLSAIRGGQQSVLDDVLAAGEGQAVGAENLSARGRRAHVPSWDEIMFGRRN